MPAKLTITNETQELTCEVPTAEGELIATIIKLRLKRGLPTPLQLESQDGTKTERVEVTDADHFSLDFGPEGDGSVTSKHLAEEALECDTYIDDGGVIRITTEDL